MNLFLVCFFIIGAVAASDGFQLPKSSNGEKHWVLLVCGSKDYRNYRHQADIAHAYQVVRQYGIPEENIVTMMFDDIAHHRQNPIKGNLINRPGGPNVYQGLVKDYVGWDVTPENFLNILTGDKSAMFGIGSGKVIESGPNDHVFVYFSDHGSPNMVSFPRGHLYASQLNQAIQHMYNAKKYGKMVIYIEACFSGSLFDRSLPSNINAMALTAANRSTSSYSCHWDPVRKAFLGDQFSVGWMDDSDFNNINVETLMQQFLKVKSLVTYSEVCMFGDKRLARDYRVAEFQGGMTIPRPPTRKMAAPAPPADAVPAPDVPLQIALNILKEAKTPEEKQKALKEYENIKLMRKLVDKLFEDVVDDVVKDEAFSAHYILTDQQPLNKDAESCYESVVDTFSENCFNLSDNDYPLRKLQAFVNLCEANVSKEKIVSILKSHCPLGPYNGAQ